MKGDRRSIPLRQNVPPGLDCPLAPPSHATVQSRALHRACVILGGVDKLADRLHASMEQVRTWMEGREPVPMQVFEQCVEVLLLYASKKGES